MDMETPQTNEKKCWMWTSRTSTGQSTEISDAKSARSEENRIGWGVLPLRNGLLRESMDFRHQRDRHDHELHDGR